MRVVALISGGKDSTFNMMQCQAEGHQIVALANLHPKDKGFYFFLHKLQKSLILLNLLVDLQFFHSSRNIHL